MDKKRIEFLLDKVIANTITDRERLELIGYIPLLRDHEDWGVAEAK